MIPLRIMEDEGIEDFLRKRQLLKQYVKSKRYVLEGLDTKTFFKERNPKWSNIWYFRINDKFRAYGSFDTNGVLRIFKIHNHQD